MSSPVRPPKSPVPMTYDQFVHFINPKGLGAFSESDQGYLPLWNKFQEKRWFLSWNWSAFFFGWVWLAYRRMYFYSIALFMWPIMLLGGLFFVWGLFPPVDPGDTYLGFALIWCIFILSDILFVILANALYLNWMAKKLVRNGQARGGVNQPFAVIMLLLWFAERAFVIWPKIITSLN